MRGLFLLAAAVSVALSLAVVSGSQAAAADRVSLVVDTRSIDGAVVFSDAATNWSWRCFVSGARRCSVTTDRGRVIGLSAENGSASSFLSWGGACAASGTQPTCTLQINSDVVVATAAFTPLRLWLPTFGHGYIATQRPDGTPVQGRPCGNACVDFANGDQVRLHAVSSGGAHRSAWGGWCEGISATHDCLVTMTSNVVVSATFEDDSPASSCPPDSSCGQVTVSSRFTVKVIGKGIVVAQEVAGYLGNTCRASQDSGRMCGFSGPARDYMNLFAIPVYGGRFLGWSGPCSGNAGCRFFNGPHPDGPPTIYARFG